MAEDVILQLNNVAKHFPLRRGLLDALTGKPVQVLKAVDGVSLHVRRGEVFGLAGESGSGKSTLGRLAIRLHEVTSGQVMFDNVDITNMSERQLRPLRRRMQPIFQDPIASMNPRMTLMEGIGHGLKIHHLVKSEREYVERVSEMMEYVGLTPAWQYLRRFPHQLSGGQRQRAVIARALVLQPEFIMADEPIAMADVSVRAVLLDLMRRLQSEFNLTYLFITHDLSTAKYICDRIAVMYLGRIVEMGKIEDVYNNPNHPYTEALLAAIPVPDPRHRKAKVLPKGEIPNPINPPSGCPFHPRCPIAQDVCKKELPPLRPVPGNVGQMAACHLRTGDYIHLDPTGKNKEQVLTPAGV